MSCLLVLATVGLQAATTPAPVAKTETPAQQPSSPLTITVKQTGQPSWKTFKRVPVEITIANNTKHDVILGAPYLGNVSLWNADMLRYKVAKLCKILGISCLGLFLLTIPAEGIKSLMNIALSYKEIDAPAFGFHCCSTEDGRHICSSHSSPVINFMQDAFAPGVLNILLSAGIILVGTTRHHIKPQETITIKGFLNKADIQKLPLSSVWRA
jgi:hypothetical protein